MQIKFTIDERAVAYLQWLAKNVLFVKSEHDAARHLMFSHLEQIRREHYQMEPNASDLVSVTPDEDD